MKKTQCVKLAGMLVITAALGLWSLTSAKAEDAPKPEEAPKITVTGLLDVYYQLNFNRPPVGNSTGLRAFDVKNDQFALSLAEVNISKAVTEKSPLGFTLTGTFGKTADIVHATEPGGTNTYKYIQQAFGSYLLGKTQVDVGKFVTAMGFEVVESSSNDNYSRGLLFTWAIPFYHAGVRITHPLTPNLTGQLHVVNGWNDVEDENGGKSVGVSLNWKPTEKINLIANYMGGDEGSNTTGGGIGFATPGIRNTQTFDIVGIWNVTPKFKLGANVDYASASSKGGSASGNWSGEAVYARYQLTDPSAFALRLEHFEDTQGIRTGTGQTLNSMTATYEYVWKSSLVTRVEFRHDHASAPGGIFVSGGGSSKDQDTLSLSQVFKF